MPVFNKRESYYFCQRMKFWKMHSGRMWIASFLLATVSACSPYVYEAEIGKISDSIGLLEQASASGQAALLADRRETILVKAANAPRSDLVLSGSECGETRSLTPRPCHALIVGESAAELTEQEVRILRGVKGTTEKDSEPGLKGILAALNGYARALRAITNAEDRTRFDAAVGSLAQSATQLAALAGPKGAAVGAVSGAAIQAAGAVVAISLDARRLAVLRETVPAMHGTESAPGAVPVLAKDVKKGLSLIRGERIRAVAARQGDLDTGLRRAVASRNDAHIVRVVAELDKLATTLGTLNQSDPDGTVEALVKAHKRLVDALEDDERQLKPLIDATSDLLTKATAVKDALAEAR